MVDQEKREAYLKRKQAYVKKYQKEAYINISFKLRKDSDQDIINILNGVPSKSLFIKELIRKSSN